VQKK
ncbi:succinyl-CoA ligase like flavodoxin domain protein, partial [Vibrio parahaemolyticus V-223/04]|jgi:hypothetical protein